MGYTFQPIGVIHSPFKEKFGIPRQPGLITAAEAELELLGAYAREEAVRGLEDFSHIWIEFVFHATAAQGWRPTVRPPRLGGNQRVGVFATRSNFRPNPIGLSVVELQGIDTRNGVRLKLSGIDLMDGTPVLDIKPYLPYADAIPGARGGFAPEPPRADIQVSFTPHALAAMAEKEATGIKGLRQLIEQLLSSDPRPAYYAKGDNRDEAPQRFGMRLYDFDLQWEITGETVVVQGLVPVKD